MSVPVATYRLQLRDGMDFDRAAGIVPYLKRLGISHLYASPIFTATTGSTHGYDVTDCNAIDPAIGGRDGFERLSAALHDAGLGLILDIVPNHMAASLENRWWRNVIEWGAHSPFARHFDIDWTEKLTLPILGQSFADILAAGEFRLCIDQDEGCLALTVYENRLPLDPSTYAAVLEKTGPNPLLEEIVRSVSRAKPADEADMHAAISRLTAEPTAAVALQTRLEDISKDRRFLGDLIDRQPWKLTYWQDAMRHLSYRRFFEVTGLVGLRVEDDRVFDDAHRLVLDLVQSGQVDGLRVDHVDGLADPAAYLNRLRSKIGPDIYLIVEKILAEEETLPASWPVAGTTGYEFIAAIADAMTDENQAEILDRAYAACTVSAVDLEAERRTAKQLMITRNFEGEVARLVDLLATVVQADSRFRVIDRASLRSATAAVIVEFPVYRTYGDAGGLSADDTALLAAVVANAGKRSPEISEPAFSAVAAALDGTVENGVLKTAAEFRSRFQQLTGPVMAKAVEDTLFYRFGRLLALNEVGGEPAATGGVAAFHRKMADRVARQPNGLLATTTHDTKRGEDARARLYAISEAPQIWARAVSRWRAMNGERVTTSLPGGLAPEPETQWMLYQALAGIWPAHSTIPSPAELESLSLRFLGFVEKALREAKLRTSWTAVDERYEAAVKAFAGWLLSPDNSEFLADLNATLQPFVRAGAINSISQTLLKLTAPGIPDIYQGSECEDFSLVDPDNRRQVDFEALARNLDDAPVSRGMGPGKSPGAVKQHIVRTGLQLRSACPDLFTTGKYMPLVASGRLERHIVAFMRDDGEHRAISITPRLPFALFKTERYDPGIWGETSIDLPPPPRGGEYCNVLSGARCSGGEKRIAELFEKAPYALLASFQSGD